MTRVEKYQSYRDEIAKSAKLGKNVIDSDENVNKYKKAINKLNPAILHNIKAKTISFDKGVIEFDIKDTKVSEEVTKMFDTLNQSAVNSQTDEINNYFHNRINHSILNDRDEIDSKWLASNKQYGQLEHINSNVTTNIVEEKSFIDDLTTKYNNMSQSNKIEQVENLQEVSLGQQNNKLKKSTWAVIGIVIAVLLALIALIIVKGVKG